MLYKKAEPSNKNIPLVCGFIMFDFNICYNSKHAFERICSEESVDGDGNRDCDFGKFNWIFVLFK